MEWVEFLLLGATPCEVKMEFPGALASEVRLAVATHPSYFTSISPGLFQTQPWLFWLCSLALSFSATATPPCSSHLSTLSHEPFLLPLSKAFTCVSWVAVTVTSGTLMDRWVSSWSLIAEQFDVSRLKTQRFFSLHLLFELIRGLITLGQKNKH